MSLFTRFSPIFRPIEALRTILLILGIITSATAANRLSEDDLDTPSLALRALNVTGSAFVALNTTQPKFSFNYSQFDSPFTGLSYSLSKLCESQYIHYLTQTTSINVATTVRTFFSGEETTVTNSTYPDGTTIVTGQTNFRTFSGPVTGNFPRYFQGHATPPCCSTCSITAETVQLFFWPTPGPTDLAGVTTAVLDNFTFTSPSAYIGFSILSAEDLCGTVGKAYTNTTLAFGPSELSTVQPCTIDDCQVSGRKGPPQRLNYADLGPSCSNEQGYFASNPSQAGGGELTLDPCHPYIALPTGVQDLDPAWKSCVIGYYGGFYDPPRVLTKVSQLVPDPTSSPTPYISPSSSPPVPAHVPIAPTPSSTQTPAPTASPAPPDADTPQIIPSEISGIDPTDFPPSSLHPTNDEQPQSSTLKEGGDPEQVSSAIDPILSKIAPQSGETPTDPKFFGKTYAAAPFSTIADLPIATGPSNGLIIGHSTTLIANGPAAIISGTTISVAPNGNLVIGDSTALAEPQRLLTNIGGLQIARLSSSAVIIGSQTISAGGPAITLASILFSLGTNDILRAGTSTISITSLLPAEDSLAEDNILTSFNGQPIAIAQSGVVVIGSQTLSDGGPATTISGIPFTIASNGNLIAGTSLIAIASLISSKDSLSIADNPLVVDGSTITPGELITVSNTPVSLEKTSDALVVGSKTFEIPGSVETGAKITDLGSLIISGLGGQSPKASTTSANNGTLEFTGGQARVYVGWRIVFIILGLWFVLGSGT